MTDIVKDYINEQWYWIELIGFDKNKEDFGVNEFLSRNSGKVYGVSLLLYNGDFVNLHESIDKEEEIDLSCCSYAGHRYNEEREIQRWTNYNLRDLVVEFHKHGVKVIFAVFNSFTYYNYIEKKVLTGKFAQQHPELHEFCSKNHSAWAGYNMLKRFKDGSYFDEYFTQKCVEVMNDYGFDGMHVADGLSSGRCAIQRGDFSDDMVEQFVERCNICLPKEISGKCDDSKTLSHKRYKYILKNFRYEFTKFWADRFGEFFQKMHKAFSANGKFMIFNNTWTCDPFEALFRYGIDYKKLDGSSTYAMMMEDVGVSIGLLPVREDWDQAPVTDQVRKYYFLDYVDVNLNLNCYMPELKILNMTTLKDTEEQWNLIDNSPNDFKRGFAKRNNLSFYNDGEYKKCCSGPIYCLSDGIPKDKWDYIHHNDEIAWVENINDVYGALVVHNDNIYKELELYIKTRRMTSSEVEKTLIKKKFPVSSMCLASDVPNLNHPIIISNLDTVEEDNLKYFEEFTNAPMLVFAYDKALKRQASFKVECVGSGLKCYFYNVKDQKDVKVKAKVQKVSNSPYDAYDCQWTKPLKYNYASNQFFERVLEKLNELSNLPQVIKATDCNLFCYGTGEKKARLIVYNNCEYFEFINLKMPFRIKDAKFVSKLDWCKPIFKGDRISFQVMNREASIIDIEIE